jgi:hypothetical protein
MSRKFIVAIAAVAALGMSIVSNDAFARGGGGGHGGGHGGGGFSSHGGGMSRGAFHGRATSTRTSHVNKVSRTSHVNKTRHAGRGGPNTKRPQHPNRHHIARHHHRHHWHWCRHHPYRCGGTWGVDVVGVDGGVAPLPVAAAPVVAAAPAAAVCTNDCDYFLKDEPGCYMAKRAFSTPVGDELRCVKICDEAEGKRAEIK